jgi:hypothetical protein
VDPKDNRILRHQLIRAATNELWGFAALAAFLVVGGGVMFLTSGWLGPSSPGLWLGLSFGSGAIAAWALGTWRLLRSR